MTKKEKIEMEEAIVSRLAEEFRSITEERINHSLRDVIVQIVKEVICESDEFRPILIECYSSEAKRIIDEEMEKINIPITVKQYAILTGLSESAIYQRKHRGQLNFEKKGMRIFLSLRELYSQLLSPHKE